MEEKKRKGDADHKTEQGKKHQSETSESEAPQATQPRSLKSKLASFKVRVISSVIMVLGFIAIIAAGHFYCCLLVLLINVCIFKEIISLKRNQQREAKLPYFFIINWYFFFSTELVMTVLFINEKIIKNHTFDVIPK